MAHPLRCAVVHGMEHSNQSSQIGGQVIAPTALEVCEGSSSAVHCHPLHSGDGPTGVRNRHYERARLASEQSAFESHECGVDHDYAYERHDLSWRVATVSSDCFRHDE